MQKKSINFAQITAVTVLVILLVGSFVKLSTNPWENSPQKLPGKIECEFYDLGGEGNAYHDEDSINNGSGKLNPANGNYLNEFRKEEGVDISYTKPNKQDDSEFNLVTPAMNQLYVGWTIPNEWINYTVNITQSGTYSIGLNYTSNGEGGISFSLDGKEISGVIKIPSTIQRIPFYGGNGIIGTTFKIFQK